MSRVCAASTQWYEFPVRLRKRLKSRVNTPLPSQERNTIPTGQTMFAPVCAKLTWGNHFCFFLAFPLAFFGVNGFGGVLSAFPIPRRKRSSAPGSSSTSGLFLDFGDMVIGPDGQSSDPVAIVFNVGRAVAIQNYAAIEHSLCFFMAHLMGTSAQVSSIIFFRIINTKSRNKILEDLIKMKIPSYLEYWKSMLKLIRKLDTKRNEIVHWTAMTHLGPSITMTLKPPDFWNRTGDAEVTISDMREFAETCNFVSRSINMFNIVIFQGGSSQQESWLQIFQQQVIYPPPDNHLLSPKRPKP